MTTDTSRQAPRINRRHSLVAGLVGVAAIATTSTVAPAEAAPTNLHPDAPLPTAWRGWRMPPEDKWGVGSTIADLLVAIDTEISCHSRWSASNAAILEAQNAHLESPTHERHQAIFAAEGHQHNQRTEQALMVGYALAMTREHAALGPEAWHNAALAFAGITLNTVDQQAADDERYNAANERNVELRGWVVTSQEVASTTS